MSISKTPIFPLKESSKLITIHTIGATFISVNNILLTPKKDYTLDSSLQYIVFTSAPMGGDTFSGRLVETSGIVVPDNCVDDAMDIINSYNLSESCYVIGEIYG